ncbi:MAG: response regulator [Gemmatimonadales bacterium]|nr:response regulator [Gemmatimonadales bacterium]
MKCLVVDDSNTMRRIVVNALKTIGFADIIEAENGQDALARLDGSIELVITDWNMPVMGGLDMVKAMRGNAATAKLPIIMVTTRGVKEDILQAVEAGVNAYVLKPFTPPTLKEKIDQVLAASAA